MRARILVLAALIGLVIAVPAQAGHHLWDFTEIFSNASGSVQYMELFTADNNEQNWGAFNITCGANTFNIGTNLPTTATANTYGLFATSNFASLPGGIAPDYIIPANFFPTGGGTLNYAGVDIWNYGAVPTNGSLALQRSGASSTNTPRNFAGAAGGVSLGGAVPASSTWGIILLSGAMLAAASGLLRKRASNPALA